MNTYLQEDNARYANTYAKLRDIAPPPVRGEQIPNDTNIEQFREYFMNPVLRPTSKAQDAINFYTHAETKIRENRRLCSWPTRGGRGIEALTYFNLRQSYVASIMDEVLERLRAPIAKARAVVLMSAPIELWYEAYTHAPQPAHFVSANGYSVGLGAVTEASTGAGTRTQHPLLTKTLYEVADMRTKELSSVHKELDNIVKALCTSRAEKLFKKRKTLTVGHIEDAFPEISVIVSGM